MRSIERRFNNIAKKNLCWSSYVCFAKTIKKRKFSKQTIHRWFYKLIDKNDYFWDERNIILFHLDNLTKPLEDNKK